ncbi:hypothetical protein GXP70_28115 [Paenibacillus lycopersici]|uniref:DegT/DnrJ/EryC1/StrS aminotransferase family protein n=1 Tax=Paenibacillus lycopersici TaxID=2704462 RepID=A0A6C0G3I0_9BACL|nr:DegT/DnrJ/EryC1/StrS family aminotransferase [Paenibacillus lycopersici]QHT63437.1 hypothetical protein GXP70_28115 [Paenibacillus lycopersici]
MREDRYEIGSEFALDAALLAPQADTLIDRLQPYRTAFYKNGRSAIRSVLRQIKGKRALLPSYICQSVIDAFERENYAVMFYTIRTDFTMDMDEIMQLLSGEADVFLLMHYYGTLQSTDDLQQLRELCSAGAVAIVEDTTHSLLTSLHTVGDYCVASLRKWFALPDGGVAYSLDNELSDEPAAAEPSFANARAAGMFLKGLYLDGLSEENELYRQLFVGAEHRIDQELEVGAISTFSRQVLDTFHAGNAAGIRSGNAAYLAERLNNRFVRPAIGMYGEGECPFFYPLYVVDRNAFRGYLNRNRIYCPVHWPITDRRLLAWSAVREISEHVISIPIDQRYTHADMNYIAKIVNEYEESRE